MELGEGEKLSHSMQKCLFFWKDIMLENELFYFFKTINFVIRKYQT